MRTSAFSGSLWNNSRKYTISSLLVGNVGSISVVGLGDDFLGDDFLGDDFFGDDFFGLGVAINSLQNLAYIYIYISLKYLKFDE